VLTVNGRHPHRQFSGAVDEINHGIQVLGQCSARRLIDYAIGVSTKLSHSLQQLTHKQHLFGQNGSAAQDLAISKDCSRILCEFTDAIDSAINELSAVEFLALKQDDNLQAGIAKVSKASQAARARRGRR
jgi:hypothetical protein